MLRRSFLASLALLAAPRRPKRRRRRYCEICGAPATTRCDDFTYPHGPFLASIPGTVTFRCDAHHRLAKVHMADGRIIPWNQRSGPFIKTLVSTKG
jgi:hypothetical protein